MGNTTGLHYPGGTRLKKRREAREQAEEEAFRRASPFAIARLEEADPQYGPGVEDSQAEAAPAPQPPQQAPQRPISTPDPQRTQADPVDGHARLRQLAAIDRPLLSHLIALTQVYRNGDTLLTSPEAKAATVAIGARLWDLDRDLAGRYARLEIKPEPVGFISFFDQLGSQQLAPFLGINEVPQGSVDPLPPAGPLTK